MDDADSRIRRLASDQHGLLTTAQTAEVGLDPKALEHRVRRGHLLRLTPRVLAVAGTPDTRARQLLARVLDAGPRAALSHTTALAFWSVRGFLLDPVHIIRHRDEGDRPARDYQLHEVRDLPDAHVRVLDGVPVVSPALALLQLAGTRSCPLGRLGRAIDAAWSDRIVSYRSLHAIDQQMSKQGRRGLRVFRMLVEERGPSYVPPASNLEARVEEILARGGRRPMRRQVDTGDGTHWIGRVDFRDDPLPVILEVQSERFHIGLTAHREDAARITRLRQAGFEVVEVTDVDVYHRPHIVLSTVDAARERAARRAA